MHGLEEAGASQMRQTSRIVAISLVGRERLESLVGLPALNADHGQRWLNPWNRVGAIRAVVKT
jgi:hypothetical protein